MATLTPFKKTARIRLNDGVDSQGNAKYVSVTFPKLEATATDAAIAAGIYAISQAGGGALGAILEKTIHDYQLTIGNYITA